MNCVSGSALPTWGPDKGHNISSKPWNSLKIFALFRWRWYRPAAAIPIEAMRRNARMGLIFTRQKRGEAIAIRLCPVLSDLFASIADYPGDLPIAAFTTAFKAMRHRRPISQVLLKVSGTYVVMGGSLA
jgi:hypothetical protein